MYYTGNTWGRAQNYHLCLDSGLTGGGRLPEGGAGLSWRELSECKHTGRGGSRAGGTDGSTGCVYSAAGTGVFSGQMIAWQEFEPGEG